MTTIAYLGTGLLGAALAEAAATRGDTVSAWNRTIEKARALEPFGVTVAESPADAVRGAAFVHLVLTNDAAVDDVIAALRPGLAPDAIILDHSTTQPALTAARAERLAGEGVRYLHCPVFVGPAAARAGKGTVLCAGPTALYEAARAQLETMGSQVRYLGERADAAAVQKLCGNAFIVGIVALVADVFAVAAGGGVSASDALEVIDLFDVKAAIAGRGRSMAARDFTPSFELAMARKDVGLMIETAGEYELAALPGIAARMDALIAQGHGGEDAAVLGVEAVGGAS